MRFVPVEFTPTAATNAKQLCGGVNIVLLDRNALDAPLLDSDVWVQRTYWQVIAPPQVHILGTPDAPIALVEYGSYACAHCRAAHNRIVEVRDEFGDRLVHAFRHRPLPGSDLAVAAAELAETQSKFAAFQAALEG